MWVVIAMIILGALSKSSATKLQAQLQKESYYLQADAARSQAGIAATNADIAGQQLLLNQAKIENKAALAGLQAAQQMASTRVSQAGSGVALNSASSYVVRASQRFSQAVNRANIEQSRVAQLSADQMNIANYVGQYVGKTAEARANTVLADAINPNKIAGQAFMSGILGGGMTTGFAEVASASGNEIAGGVTDIDLTNSSTYGITANDVGKAMSTTPSGYGIANNGMSGLSSGFGITGADIGSLTGGFGYGR